MSDVPADPKERSRALFNLVAPDYDTIGPRSFSHFGRRLVALAGVEEGHRVLDVATGRGAVLLPAAEIAGPTGEVVGIDFADAMVAATGADIAARGLRARTMRMDAEDLEFAPASFDRVFCGFGIMFLGDRPAAMRGFRRVLRPGGRLAVSTWRQSNAEELHGALVELGRDAPRQPGWITEPAELEAVLAAGGFARVQATIDPHTLVFASVAEYVAVSRSTGARRLVDGLSADEMAALHAALERRFVPYRGAGGFHVPVSALIGIADA